MRKRLVLCMISTKVEGATMFEIYLTLFIIVSFFPFLGWLIRSTHILFANICYFSKNFEALSHNVFKLKKEIESLEVSTKNLSKVAKKASQSEELVNSEIKDNLPFAVFFLFCFLSFCVFILNFDFNFSIKEFKPWLDTASYFNNLLTPAILVLTVWYVFRTLKVSKTELHETRTLLDIQIQELKQNSQLELYRHRITSFKKICGSQVDIEMLRQVLLKLTSNKPSKTLLENEYNLYMDIIINTETDEGKEVIYLISQESLEKLHQSLNLTLNELLKNRVSGHAFLNSLPIISKKNLLILIKIELLNQMIKSNAAQLYTACTLIEELHKPIYLNNEVDSLEVATSKKLQTEYNCAFYEQTELEAIENLIKISRKL